MRFEVAAIRVTKVTQTVLQVSISYVAGVSRYNPPPPPKKTRPCSTYRTTRGLSQLHCRVSCYTVPLRASTVLTKCGKVRKRQDKQSDLEVRGHFRSNDFASDSTWQGFVILSVHRVDIGPANRKIFVAHESQHDV